MAGLLQEVRSRERRFSLRLVERRELFEQALAVLLDAVELRGRHLWGEAAVERAGEYASDLHSPLVRLREEVLELVHEGTQLRIWTRRRRASTAAAVMDEQRRQHGGGRGNGDRSGEDPATPA